MKHSGEEPERVDGSRTAGRRRAARRTGLDRLSPHGTLPITPPLRIANGSVPLRLPAPVAA